MRHIVREEPERDMEADGFPSLRGPMPPSTQDFTVLPNLIHQGTGDSLENSSRGTGGYDSGRGTAPIQVEENNFGRPTANTHRGNLLDDISEEGMNSSVEENNEELENCKRRIHQLEIEAQKLNKIIAEQNGDLDANNLEKDKMIVEYDEYIDRLQEEMDQYKATEGLVEKLTAEKEYLEEEIDKVYKIKEMLLQQLNNQDESVKLQEVREKNSLLAEENQRLKRLAQATGDVGENAKLKNAIKSLEKQMNFVQKENALLKQENDDL